MKVKIVLLLLAGLVWASPAFAAPTVTLLGHGYGTTDGGEFVWQVASGSIPGHNAGDNFIGFCLEQGETINYHHTYDASIDTAAIEGGNGGQDGTTYFAPSSSSLPSDSLDARSAWLFGEYLSGHLGARSDTLANQVQSTIWAWEGEGGTAAYSPTSGDILSGQNLINTGKVYVVNVYTQNQDGTITQNQSQIVAVPAPGAILLAGLGTCLVGFLRRRKSLSA